MCPLFTCRRFRLALCLALVSLASLHFTAALAEPIRVVTYNILADSGGYTTARPGFTTVIQGIGNEDVNGVARPLDILALQETTSNTTTVAPIVTSLNNIYGAGTYAMSPYQATQNGSASSGNGPNAMVYKTTSLQLIASVGIGTPSTSGAPRQPVRYQFRPVGGSAADDFYVYVSHCKAGTGSSNENRRNIEAQLLRADAATLPAASRIIYSGDFNLTRSTEAAFQTLTAAGQGQAFDPPNRLGNWDSNAAFIDVMTYGSTSLRYRDDFHLITANVQNDASGLQYIAGSFHTFAINGSTPLNGTVNSPSNTAFPTLPNRAAVLSALTTASDHLPVVADFNLPTGNQAPAITGQPDNQTVCAGLSASFTVAASGTPAPTFRWRRGTTELTDGGNLSGTTTGTLVINPGAASDAADNYNCVVTNTAGTATSNNAALTVNVGPSITTQPQGLALIADGTAVFTVTASGSPAPAYRWRKNTIPLTDGDNISGAATATLTVHPVTTADAGNYDVVITNTCGTATSDRAPLWRRGDLNCDGSVNGLDISDFVLALLDPTAYAGQHPNCTAQNGDFNSDGVTNKLDIAAFVTALLAE